MSDSERQLPPSRDRALDQLLRQAAWPEPDPAAVERLRDHLRSLLAEKRRRWLRQRMIAAAAAVLLAAAAWLFWHRPGQENIAIPDAPPPGNRVRPDAPPPQGLEPPVTNRDRNAPPGLATGARGGGPAAQPPTQETGYVWSQPATAYQEFVVAAVQSRQSARPAARRDPAAQAQPRPEVDPLETALQALIADPAADLMTLTKPLMPRRDFHEQQLLEQLPRAALDRKQAAIQLLAHLGSARSVPALLQLSRAPETHGAAIRAVMPHADARLLGGLIRQEPDRALQRELLIALLSRGQSPAVAAYLELIAEPGTRDPALEALDAVSHPPVELLFGFLNGAEPAQQLAAALVLGRLNGPQITRRLIQQASSNMHQQPALIALLANRSEEARRFVSFAQRDQSLFAAVHSARLQFQFLQPSSPGDRS